MAHVGIQLTLIGHGHLQLAINDLPLVIVYCPELTKSPLNEG